MKRILITGGQGFIGRYLAAHWLTTNERSSVLCVGRSPARGESFTHRVSHADRSVLAPLPESLKRALRSPAYEYSSVDVNDRARMTRLLARFRPQVVVHLAGALRDDPVDTLLASTIGSVVRVLEAIAGAGIEVEKIVHGSSCAVYGVPQSIPIREDAPCLPLEPYAASKLAAEQLARAYAAHNELPLTIARIFNPIGAGEDERHFCARLCSQLAAIRSGKRSPVVELASLASSRDFIDVRDVAAALALLAERGVPGVCYNVGSGREQAIEVVFRRALELAGLLHTVTLKTGSRPGGTVFRHVADTTRLESLGFSAETPLDDSLRDMLAYYGGPVASAASNGTELDTARAEYPVEVAARHTYTVVVESGVSKQLPVRLASTFPGARVFVLSDEHVQSLYGRELLELLIEHGISAASIVVLRGEAAKSQDSARQVIEKLYRGGFDRRALLVNLGGGAICDLGGYVASCYLRGVAYVNVPTTLLAQHDAAIGGKVAVNAPWGKNFVGAFHHPAAVYCDPVLLQSLDRRAISAGIAEAIKVAICGDEKLFSILECESAAIVQQRHSEILAEVVRRAARTKIEILSADPLEVDLRRALNLGHTFGHALETELGYEDIVHGEAVAFGLAVAVAIALRRGVCESSAAERILRLLDAYGLPPKVSRMRLEASIHRLGALRLVRGQRLLFVLPTSTSSVRISDEIDDSEFFGAIDYLARHPVLRDRVAEGAES
jgi:3-dehydroquinate synthase